MQSALSIKTTVLPGGKIEVIDDTLQAGESVVVIVLPQRASTARQSAVDILAGAPGNVSFTQQKRSMPPSKKSATHGIVDAARSWSHLS